MIESKILKQLDKSYRLELKKLFLKLTPPQQNLFKRMYPKGIDNMNNKDIRIAIQQCERTIEENN